MRLSLEADQEEKNDLSGDLGCANLPEFRNGKLFCNLLTNLLIRDIHKKKSHHQSKCGHVYMMMFDGPCKIF